MTSDAPGERRRLRGRSIAELVASGDVSAHEAYHAAVVLERLHDRGVARGLTLEEMCEVLGYAGRNRRPEAGADAHAGGASGPP